MTNFLIFYAPFIVVILGVAIVFWWSPRDAYATKKDYVEEDK
ncbi:MAG: hypothetical protein RR595_15405 [Lysinibacillus sp.]